MLIPVLGVLVVLLAGFALAVSRRPAAYRVERVIDITAPSGPVFAELNDLDRLSGCLVLFGQPLHEFDPQLQKSLSGPPSGPGQTLRWSGNFSAGRCTLTLVESTPDRGVGITMAFEKPMVSKVACTLALAEAPGGTRVAWSMAGRHNILGKAMGLFMDMDMDKSLGADIEAGLGRLKRAVEEDGGAARPL